MKKGNTEGCFESVREEFPISFSIGDKRFFINLATPFELEELREKGNFDIELMTCRPIIERTKQEYIGIFRHLIEDDSNLLLGIYHDDGEGKIIGRISFFDNNPRNRSVEMGYVLMENWQGQGIMNTSLQIIMEKLFDTSDLNKIYAQTCEINIKSRNLLEKFGFCPDAKLRQHHVYNGTYYDDYIYSFLRGDAMKVFGTKEYNVIQHVYD